jgi:hypothetical protein
MDVPWLNWTDLNCDFTAIPEDRYLTVDLDIYFRGEFIRTKDALLRKLHALFDERNLRTADASVKRKGNDFEYQIVIDKTALRHLTAPVLNS